MQFSNPFRFSGRIPRAEFIAVIVLATVLSYLLARLSLPLARLELLSVLAAFALKYFVAAATCKRLHDVNRSGWWQSLWAVPALMSLATYWPAFSPSPESGLLRSLMSFLQLAASLSVLATIVLAVCAGNKQENEFNEVPEKSLAHRLFFWCVARVTAVFVVVSGGIQQALTSAASARQGISAKTGIGVLLIVAGAVGLYMNRPSVYSDLGMGIFVVYAVRSAFFVLICVGAVMCYLGFQDNTEAKLARDLAALDPRNLDGPPNPQSLWTFLVSFQGRIPRGHYALFTVLSIASVAGYQGLLAKLIPNKPELGTALLTIVIAFPVTFVFGAVVGLMNFAVGAKRLHDMGYSGWWQLIYVAWLFEQPLSSLGFLGCSGCSLLSPQ